MDKPVKKPRRREPEECVDPVVGPRRMALNVQRLLELTTSIAGNGYRVDENTSDAFEDILNEMVGEHSRGAQFGRGLERAAENIRRIQSTVNHPAQTSDELH